MFALLIALQVSAATPQSALVPLSKPTDRIAAILRKGDGKAESTAYKVKSVDEEYEILRVFGLKPAMQSLVTGKNKKPYDVLDATDPRTGETFSLWFDISAVPSIF